MTENAFYPVFCLVALALVVVLERPTVLRQLALLAFCAVAFLIRAQAVAFLPALFTAPLILAWFERRPRALLQYRVLWGASIAALIVVPLAARARKSAARRSSGRTKRAGHVHYSLGGVLRWLL